MQLSFPEFIKYVAVLIVASLLTFFFHEMFHWIGYQLLGYDAGFTLNGAGVKDSSISLTKTHRIITSALGPIFTIIQAVVFFFILKKRKNILLYPFLFLPFVMRLGAGWANRFQPNDEGRISLDLGLNLYVVSAVVVAFLFYLIFKISRENKISWVLNLITLVLSLLLLLGIAFIDFKFKIRFV